MSKRRNRRLRETRNEVLSAMAPVNMPRDNALTRDELPPIVRHAVNALANALHEFGVNDDKAGDAGHVYVCMACRAMGVWPAIVAEVHGIRV